MEGKDKKIGKPKKITTEMSFFGKVNFSFRHSYSTHTHRDLLPPTTFSPLYCQCIAQMKIT